MVTQISIVVRPEEKEEWEKQAEEEGLSLSKWAARRLRSGERLWKADGFQLNLQENDAEDTTVKTTSDGELEDLILSNLSSDPDEALSIPEIVELVRQEQKNQIATILETLDEEGQVAYKPTKGGYVKE